MQTDLESVNHGWTFRVGFKVMVSPTHMSRHAGQSVRCYVINLDRSVDRLNSFTRNAMEQGLQFTRISAVDGRDIGGGMQTRLLQQGSGLLPLGPGEMGCFLSHRLAWQEILNHSDDWAFIAEDDVHFCNASEFFASPDWIPPQATVIKAETARQRIRLDTKLIAQPFGHELRLLRSYHGGAAAYFVSRSGAKMLLQKTTDRCDPTDHILFHKDFGVSRHMNIMQIDPAICVQDYLVKHKCRDLMSTLDEDRRQSRNVQGMHGKPEGLAKIWRELSRPFVQIVRFVWAESLTLLKIQLIKRIKYVGDITS